VIWYLVKKQFRLSFGLKFNKDTFLGDMALTGLFKRFELSGREKLVETVLFGKVM